MLPDTWRKASKIFANEERLSHALSLLLLMPFICVIASADCAFSAESRGGDSFQKQYKKYQGHVKAGYAAINKKEYGKAIDHYTKAIAASPFEASHYYYRGLAWYRKGDRDKAIGDFDKVIVLNSRWSNAYIYRGLCWEKSGNYGKALDDYKRALNLKPQDVSVHNNLAWLYATAKDEKFRDKVKALEHASKAAVLSNEKNAEILDTLSMAYFINGKVTEAVETQKKALKLEPDNQGFKKHLEEYEKAMKD